MFKSLVVLAVSSMMATSAVAQVQPVDAAAATAAAAKPQTVKKRVCFRDEEDSYSRMGGRKICKTVEVPVQSAANGGQSNQTAPAPSGGNANQR